MICAVCGRSAGKRCHYCWPWGVSAARTTNQAGDLLNARNLTLRILLRHVKISVRFIRGVNRAVRPCLSGICVKIVLFSSGFRRNPQKSAARGVDSVECTLYGLRMLFRQNAADILFIIINNISLPLGFREYSTGVNREGN